MHQTFPLDDLKRVDFIKYEHFFHNFLKQNKLCIFSSALTKHWRSRNEWVRDGKPNFDFLTSAFGNSLFSFLVFVYFQSLCGILKFGSELDNCITKLSINLETFQRSWLGSLLGMNRIVEW